MITLPVNPTLAHSAFAAMTVRPERSGTVKHGVGVGVGAAVGVGTGVGVGLGVGFGVTFGVAIAVAVGAGVSPGAAVSFPPAGVGFERGVEPGTSDDPAEGPSLGDPDAPALAVGSPIPAVDDPGLPLEPSPPTAPGRAVARPSAPPTEPSHPIVESETSERTAINATSMAAARRSSFRRRRRGLTPVAVAAAAPQTSYGAAHIGHRPRALSQHQRHAYRWHDRQWHSPTCGPIASMSTRRAQRGQTGGGGSPYALSTRVSVMRSRLRQGARPRGSAGRLGPIRFGPNAARLG